MSTTHDGNDSVVAEPIDIRLDSSNLRAVLQKMCNQINILMRKMKDIEDKNLDQISEMAHMKTVFDKEKKQSMNEYDEKFEELGSRVDNLAYELSELKTQVNERKTTNTAAADKMKKKVTNMDVTVKDISESIKQIRERMAKDTNENRANINKNWLTISGLKPIIENKADKVWLDHKADKEWVADQLATFVNKTAKKSEVKRLNKGMLANQKTVDTVKYQLETLLTQYYKFENKSLSRFKLAEARLDKHAISNTSFGETIKKNQEQLSKIQSERKNPYGTPSDTVTLDEVESKLHDTLSRTAGNSANIEELTDNVSNVNKKVELCFKRITQINVVKKGDSDPSEQFQSLSGAIEAVRKETKGELLERVKLMEDRYQVSMNRISRQMVDLQERMSSVVYNSDSKLTDTTGGKTRCIMCDQETNMVRGPASERYVRERVMESKDQTPKKQPLNRNFELSLGSNSAALHVVKGKETHVYSKSGQVYRGREEDRVEVRTLSSSLKSDFARGSGNVGAKQRRRPASAQPRRTSSMASPGPKNVVRRIVYAPKTGHVHRARSSPNAFPNRGRVVRR